MSELSKKINTSQIIVGISLLVALGVYFRFLSFGHISWDDPEMVFKNKAVKTFNVNDLLGNHFVGNYIPVTMLTHAFAWFLFGNNDLGHHLLNILLHLTNGLLLYMLGKRLFKNATVAITGLIIFLLHPVQMESVGWISELKNLLSTTFYLLGSLAYLKYSKAPEKKYYALCFLFFVLGCLSKSSVVIFPISLICFDMIQKQNINGKLIVNKIPLFFVSILFGLINIKAQTEDLFINYSHAFPYAQRIGYAGFALAKYILLFIAPFNLSVIYPYPQNSKVAQIIGYAVLILIAFVIYTTIKGKKFNYTALIIFTLFNLVLVLQFIPFGEVLFADRYMYIPLIGLAWMLGFVIDQLKLSTRIVFPILIVLLSISSFSRSNVWKSGLTLYEDILHNFPNSFVALNSIGVEYMLRDNNTKALYYLNKSINVAPYNYKGFYNRGLFYLKNQKPAEAIKNFDQSLSIYEYSKSYVGRASAYHMQGDLSKAIKDAQSGLRIEKNNSKAHFVLGNCYNEQNKLDEALSEYNKSITLNDGEAEFYFKRAIVYGKKQEFEKCINDIDLCLAIDPIYYEAYYWRGVAKVNLGQNGCSDFEIAARQNFEPASAAFKKYCR